VQNPSSLTNSRQWGQNAPKSFERSPLNQYLHACIMQDQDIAALRELIPAHQPFHVLFFTVINYLLLSEEGQLHPFAAFHPYFTSNPRPVQESYPYFRDFCLEHIADLRRLLPTARLQTNEVTRCANFLPVFELVYQRGGCRPLALIEIGTSAGFNLSWDRYAYTYHATDNTVYTIGDAASPVQINCTLQGASLPQLPETMPVVASRVGIDLMPLDCLKEQDVRWLRACIWPEETWRYHLLDAVLAVAQQNPPRILSGDACDLLPNLLSAIPAEHTVCLYHSYALLQNPALVRERIFAQLAAHSSTRDLYRISLEWDQPNQWPTPRLELFTYQSGEQVCQERLANCDVHGGTMQWLFTDV